MERQSFPRDCAGERDDFNLGLMAGFAGAAIPLLLKAFKFDPALGSGIIVTGLTDAFGFLSFLGLATLFRHYLV